MREKNFINVSGKEIEFIELYYMDGPKLEVSDKTKSILVWYDEFMDGEEWLYIQSDEMRYEQYISNKIPLLEVIKNNNIFLAKRYFKSYNEIEIINKIGNIEEYKYMPSEKSFLNFDYAKERDSFFNNKFSIEALYLMERSFISSSEEKKSISLKEPSQNIYSLFDNIYKTDSSYIIHIEENLLPSNQISFLGANYASR